MTQKKEEKQTTYRFEFIKATDLSLRNGLRRTEIFKVKSEDAAKTLAFFQESKEWTNVELLVDVHSMTEL